MEKPQQIKTVGTLMLISGIWNVLYGLGATFVVVVGSLGLGLLCAPITILPSILGVFEIINASKLMGGDDLSFSTVQTLSILEITTLLFGNVLSAIFGIIGLVFYNSPEVKAYYAKG
ncbi:MAG: hypothetical protein EPO32_03590 [Anaerolineae bacterium]|nr:MAG: hypothetical protein EPO32_03590 [Anaerolineae bacterium]